MSNPAPIFDHSLEKHIFEMSERLRRPELIKAYIEGASIWTGDIHRNAWAAAPKSPIKPDMKPDMKAARHAQ